MALSLKRVLETCLYVDDLDAAERFYVDVLGLVLNSKQAGRHVFLRCGTQMVLLFDPRASNDSEATFPHHGAIGPGHVAFAVDASELDGWRCQLGEFGVAIERTILWPQGGASLYFRDPAGNSLEIATPSIWSGGNASPS